MTKIEDPSIRVRDRGLQDYLSDLTILWNRGKIGFTKVTSTSFTDTPSDVEVRFRSSDAGAAELYVFIPGSASNGSGWWSVSLTEKST